MLKRFLVLLAIVAMFVTALPEVATAQPPENPGDSDPPIEVARSTTGSYIVVMVEDPLVATVPQDQLNSPGSRSQGRALARGHDKALADAQVGQNNKVQSYTNALNGFAAVMSFEEAKRVAGLDEVLLVLPDEMRYLDTDSSTTFLGLDAAGGAWLTGRTGENVIVGVIDSGIWPEHPSFADDGTYSDLGLSIGCDFGNTAHNPVDVAFACNNKLIGARQMLATYRAIIGASPSEFDSARDDNGHGTHTASTAAGNANVAASIFGQSLGTVSGVAPRARVIAYKGLGELGGFTSDLAAAIDQAVLDGVNVINYSVGGGAGAPGGDEIAFLFADAAGVFVATSAGNSGPDPKTLGNPGTMPWMTTVGASTQTRFFQGTATLGSGAQYIGSSITLPVGTATLVDAENHGGDLCLPGSLDAGAVDGNVVLCRRGAIGRADKSLAVAIAGGVGMILYNNVDSDNLFTDTHHVPSIHIDNTPGLEIKAYIAANPGTATAAITTGELSSWDPAPSMTIFSSRGPNPVSPDILKPDVTAPGLQILAGNTPAPGGGVSGELFQAIAGTSMSSPHVAGLLALLKQEHPDWSPAMARSALMTTSHQNVRDNDRVSAANVFSMGAGHVDPGRPNDKGSSFQPGLAYDAGLFEYAAYTCGENFGVFSSGTCDFLAGLGVPSDPSDLNLPSIGIAELAGSQTVTRTVTSVASENGWRTYDVSVEAPPGFTVTVSPTSLRLKPGDTATYTVTIVNQSGAPNVWSHGSLTWEANNGLYSVYSPIAVKASLFSAPAAVAGSGESGSASFGVDFGYSGPYTAAAHGLEAATVTTDNVLQDPDQTFSPADVGAGANAHTFNLSGEALFRIAMPPEATEANADLDIFVADPSGTIVAASTAGGTNELVDLANPVDGTWTVYVHGWASPGGDSDYDLFTWVISATPGGNMSVDSAPASAVIGTSGVIDVSWTGAALSQWHLGAVSHSDAGGLLGLTLVEVDNR